MSDETKVTPRGYDRPWEEHCWLARVTHEGGGVWYSYYVCDGSHVGGRWEKGDNIVAQWAEYKRLPMRLVMHADGTLVDPNCEEAAWL